MTTQTNEEKKPALLTEIPQKAGGREWLGLAVLALPTLLLSIDLSVLHLALPQLSADLGANSTELLWITDIYGFMIAGLLITMGTLGDRIGRRKLLMIGGAAFGVASVLAAYSTSPTMLIITRALMGIAGATLMPSTLALISNMFTVPRQRGIAIAVWMSCFMGGMAFGPVVGGVFIELFWWGAAFLLGVPIMLLLLGTAPFLLPEFRNTKAGNLDLISVALLLATILPIIYGLKELARHGWQVGGIAVAITGICFGLLFCYRQVRLTHPLLDLNLFSNRTFSAALVISLIVGAVQGGILFLMNMYLQLVEGLSPLIAGLWLVPSSLAMIAATMLAPFLVKRVRPAYIIAAGLMTSAIGYQILSQLDINGGLSVAIIGIVMVMMGVGPMGALSTDLIVGSAPPEKSGAAAAVSESAAEFGIALGIAALGSLGTSIYRSQMLIPEGVPVQFAEAASESIISVVSIADQLDAPLGTILIGVAREAFTNGLNASALLSTFIFIALALASIIFLRHVSPSGEVLHDQMDENRNTQSAIK
ncbi:MFS transporter [Bacillus horti]|uniref:DHA2 family multidrug resistance protein-like MFS transporter n=1 Tax=Caldalkalibacillus horti TaxID=77523 RepID=A0ABT9W010_9BACI|nr:MFS transporter [Bacillus horti]MDQ0166200.1 DHA2 family multidrug resistance protein-like MFS transporter [Bacillus horti]